MSNRLRRIRKKGIFYKTDEDLAIIKDNGNILGRCHGEIAKRIKPGVTTSELDSLAQAFIQDHDAIPSFLDYNGFPAALCISINDAVVHGIPDNYALQNGDIVSIDCGVFKNNFHADSAYTYPIGEVKSSVLDLLENTKESLYIGIEQATKGKRLQDIGFAIQQHAKKKGYSIVRELTGHGVGKNLHENPEVPNYGRRSQGMRLQNNLVLAIEPMINMGKRNVYEDSDGWTIRTRDKKPSAHFEHTIAIKDYKAEILTTFKYIEEIFPDKKPQKNLLHSMIS